MRQLSDLPPGISVNDIEDQIEGNSVTGQLDAILNDPLADAEEEGIVLTGKPYGEDETPVTVEEARETLLEMRRVLLEEATGLGDNRQLAQALANETGLQVEEDDDDSDEEEYLYLFAWQESQAEQDYWQRVLQGEE